MEIRVVTLKRIVDGKEQEVAYTQGLMADLKIWDKNQKARTISKKNLERLKQDILRLGFFDPIKVNTGEFWGEAGLMLGGNMRYLANSEIGDKWAFISLVSPKDEKEALDYMLADNDHYGEWNTDGLAEILQPYPDLRHNLVLGGISNTENLLNQYGPPKPKEGEEGNEEDRDQDYDKTDDKLHTYLTSGIRQIVLYMDVETYNRTIDRLVDVHRAFNVDNNTDAFFSLLDFWEKLKDEQT